MTNEIPNIVRTSRIFTKVEMKHLDLYFSYDRLVAFVHNHPNEGVKTVVRVNQFGSATGRHLNQIDGGSLEARRRRVYLTDFEDQVKALNL